MTTAYNPQGKSRVILDRAMEHIQSVPYAVTSRWLFYRLLDDGLYTDKKRDYRGKFLKLITRARKSFWNGWRPDTLADDTREAVIRGEGYATVAEWLGDLQWYRCTLDKWAGQPFYVELWFEAMAMRAQFEYYTKDVTLRPFHGDPSLDFKWRTAQHLRDIAAAEPDREIVVLYFGDLDRKGLTIPEYAAADIRAWSGVDFELRRCGLNPGDEVRYQLQENFERPGTYQWESLDDGPASELISSSIAPYLENVATATLRERETAATARYRTLVRQMVRDWTDDGGTE